MWYVPVYRVVEVVEEEEEEDDDDYDDSDQAKAKGFFQDFEQLW